MYQEDNCKRVKMSEDDIIEEGGKMGITVVKMSADKKFIKNIQDMVNMVSTSYAANNVVAAAAPAVLAKGEIMVIGGKYSHHNGTQILDYTNNVVREGPKLAVGRWHHAAACFNGIVFVFGGCDERKSPKVLSSCERYDSVTGEFSVVADMKRPRGKAAACVTGCNIIVIGGHSDNWILNTCELYDPCTDYFFRSKARMTTERCKHTASLLPDGRIFVYGGYMDVSFARCTVPVFTRHAEIYDPESDSFSQGPLESVMRAGHTATAMADGRILIAGGEEATGSKSTEIYDPKTNSFSKGPDMLVARIGHYACLVGDRVVIGGGWSGEAQKTTEIYDPKSNSISQGFNLGSPKVNTVAVHM